MRSTRTGRLLPPGHWQSKAMPSRLAVAVVAALALAASLLAMAAPAGAASLAAGGRQSVALGKPRDIRSDHLP